jgi:TrmH family RNA methyltransferase
MRNPDMARPKSGKGKGRSPRLSIVLVQPKFPGNIGAVARVMKNFDVQDLVLVDPCPVDEEAYQRAMHATDILEKARRFKDPDEALPDLGYLVGTSRESTRSDKKHLRKAISPRELVAHLSKIEGTVSILFGREDFGLFNSEIARCDILVTIPASKEYPVLNVSHAVAVVLYELYMSKAKVWKPPPSTDFEREKMVELFGTYLDTVGYPAHKRKKATVMLKRIIGRADVSKWEFHTVMGLFSQAIKKINRLEAKKRPKGKARGKGRKKARPKAKERKSRRRKPKTLK